jgi:hypothetical protein
MRRGMLAMLVSGASALGAVLIAAVAQAAPQVGERVAHELRGE